MADERRRALALFSAGVAATLLLGCGKGTAGFAVDGGADAGAPFACTVVAPTVCPDPAPRYKDVETIFAQRCVDCHFGAPEGPWPLNDYQQIADWADVVRTDLLSCSMPPADAGGAPMTDQERAAILTWILCGHLNN